MECIFTLKYDVGEQYCDPDALVERLGAVGCTDALVGTGKAGYLALEEFAREADSVESAVRAALADIEAAIPSATLVNISRDVSVL
tara:strand:- start:595 stop:852 length:258 start_codon:yes stop_codon:yes gene_type:complete